MVARDRKIWRKILRWKPRLEQDCDEKLIMMMMMMMMIMMMMTLVKETC